LAFGFSGGSIHYLSIYSNYSMKNTILLSVVLILAQGCTSINQPKASRALVEQQFTVPGVSANLSLSAALSNSKAGTVLAIQQQPVVMGSKFFAATGLTCRRLTSEQAGQYIYCLDGQGSWFKVNKVISEYNESDMPEASL
jgi:hypothetical protein